ncbi:MAG: DDE-type integrase/transposase/recombinase [Desulfobacterales bacterium]|nr:DDE-type integrase/transposase/recombinase [Desulfobacterales bacterium]
MTSELTNWVITVISLLHRELLAEQRFEDFEIRSYESQYVNALWHCDFHHGSLKALLPDGQWRGVELLGVLDDCSRLCAHAQWYLSETAENLIHGLMQGFEKYDLPRGLMSDNGSAMTAAETVQGLARLGIVHEKTLPYSPQVNGKQECFWGQVEGRLLAMLEGCKDLTLAQLNEATLAWVDREYNREVHSEIGEPPLSRFLTVKNLGRACPESRKLREAFTAQVLRTQRQSDGTISLEGIRFELPSRYRHLKRVTLRYACGTFPESISPTRKTDRQSAGFIHKTSTRMQTDGEGEKSPSSRPGNPPPIPAAWRRF